MDFDFFVEGGDFSSAGSTSSAVKKLMKQLGIDPDIIKRTVVALYEAEVNIVAHADRGKVHVEIEEDKIHITLEDEGQGIPNIEQAMQKGFSTASVKVREMGFGAGMGLPNMKANSDILDIKSEVNKGTIVDITNFY
jgi:anti-sigma regulatory factor (Ser/Thr protein kinase)